MTESHGTKGNPQEGQRLAVSVDVAMWFHRKAIARNRFLERQQLMNLIFLAWEHAWHRQDDLPDIAFHAIFIAGRAGPVEPNVERVFASGAPEWGSIVLTEPLSDLLEQVWSSHGEASQDALFERIERIPVYGLACRRGLWSVVRHAVEGSDVDESPISDLLAERFRRRAFIRATNYGSESNVGASGIGVALGQPRHERKSDSRYKWGVTRDSAGDSVSREPRNALLNDAQKLPGGLLTRSGSRSLSLGTPVASEGGRTPVNLKQASKKMERMPVPAWLQAHQAAQAGIGPVANVGHTSESGGPNESQQPNESKARTNAPTSIRAGNSAPTGSESKGALKKWVPKPAAAGLPVLRRGQGWSH